MNPQEKHPEPCDLSNARILIVSGANSDYYNLLTEMLASLDAIDFKFRFETAVFDYGLMLEEREALLARNIQLKSLSDLDAVLPPNMSHNPSIQATYGKLTLDKQFPGYDIYIWVDADIWFQSSLAIQHFAEGALNNKMVMVPEVDCSYMAADPFKGVRYRAPRIKQLIMAYDLIQGESDNHRATKEMLKHYHLNGGIFALKAGAPHWNVWLDCYLQALRKGPEITGLAQTCASYLLFTGKLAFHPMPATYNWLCHKVAPRWDHEKRSFVTPMTPRNLIHVMHLTAGAKKNETLRFGFMARQEGKQSQDR